MSREDHGVLGGLVELLLPSVCAGCGRGGGPWCAGCGSVFGAPRQVRWLAGGIPVYALAPYGGAARAALLAYKERDRRELAGPLGLVLGAGLAALPAGCGVRDGCWVVPAPSRRRAARRRGGDHLRRLVRHALRSPALRPGRVAGGKSPGTVAEYPGTFPVAPVAPDGPVGVWALRLRRDARDSVGLDAAGRAANLAGRVIYQASAPPPLGTPIVLVDDLITTGATAAACRAALDGAGGRVAAVLTLCTTVLHR